MKLYTCNRCDNEMFLEDDKPTPYGWVNVAGIGPLCPECYEEYRIMVRVMRKIFMMEDNHGRTRHKTNMR